MSKNHLHRRTKAKERRRLAEEASLNMIHSWAVLYFEGVRFWQGHSSAHRCIPSHSIHWTAWGQAASIHTYAIGTTFALKVELERTLHLEAPFNINTNCPAVCIPLLSPFLPWMTPSVRTDFLSSLCGSMQNLAVPNICDMEAPQFCIHIHAHTYKNLCEHDLCTPVSNACKCMQFRTIIRVNVWDTSDTKTTSNHAV